MKSIDAARSSNPWIRACPSSTAMALVTLWNDALERILDCPRERALGRSLVAAVPALGKTELPRAIADVLDQSALRGRSRISRCLPPRVRGRCRSESFPSPAA